MPTNRIVLAAVTALGLATLVATPVSASAINAQVYFQHPNCGGGTCFDASSASGFFTGSIFASMSATVVTAGTGGSLTTTGVGDVTAAYGMLKVSTHQDSVSTATGAYPDVPFIDSVTASASFDDVFSFTATAAGVAHFGLIVDGSHSTARTAGYTQDFGLTMGVHVTLAGPGGNYLLDLFTQSSTAGVFTTRHTIGTTVTDVASMFGMYDLVIPYVAGVNNIGLQMTAFCNSGTRTTSGAGTFTSDCDLGHTVRWGGLLSALDNATGAPVALSISSPSGTNYLNEIGAADVATAPEPASLLLLGAGLLGASARRWRKRTA